MIKTTFIGIVSSQGTSDCAWNGAFEFDDLRGYVGKLLSTNFSPKHGQHLFDTPEELDKTVLHCLIDGSDYGTIIWPEFRGVQVKNFRVQIFDLHIKNLVRGVHIDGSEKDIQKIIIQSPAIGQLFKLKAYSEVMQFSPRKLTIESISHESPKFSTSIGQLSIGIEPIHSVSRNDTAPSLEAVSYFEIELQDTLTVVDALKLTRKIEHLLSLLSLQFVKASKTQFSIPIRAKNENETVRTFEVERARSTKDAKSKIEWDDVIFDLSKIDIGSLFTQYLKLFDDIEQTLNWYRILTLEDRYLEDKFFYAVRMIEALYRALKLNLDIDQDALESLKKINAVLSKSPDNNSLVEFLTKRAAPIFSRPSLSDVFKDLRSRYSALEAVDVLDSRFINRLRGKEAHGSTERFTGSEYQFMAHTYEVIRILYVLLVLESCGASRSLLVEGVQRSHKYGRYFNARVREEYLAARNKSE